MASMAKRGACRQFLAEGHCSWGDRCRFWHPEARSASAGGGRRQSAAEVEPQQQQRWRQQQQQQRVPRGRWRPEPAYKTRAWCSADGESAAAPAAPGRTFRVMSYNVLADELAQSHKGELYRRTPPEQLEWSRRWGLMAAEIRHHAPDLVCLQEVDHWEAVAADMSNLGFQGAYAQRSGGRADGCATFWRSSVFEGARVGALRFSEYDMRDNVGLLALLRLKQGAAQQQGQGQSRRRRRQQQQAQQQQAQQAEQQQQQQQQQQHEDVQPMEHEDGQQQQQQPQQLEEQGGPLVAVANTHILFNPKRGDLKVGQLRLLIHSLPLLVAQALPAQAAQAQQCGVPCLLMGDLNTLPTSPIYRFLRTGALHCLQQHRKDLAGTGDELSTNIARRSRSVPAFGQQQQQQWSCYEAAPGRWRSGQGGAASWFNGSGLAMPSLHQQQQQHAHMQQQHHGGLQRSVSTPVLTLRKLRAAGWSAEELVIATGGVHGSHLRHCLEQLAALRRQQRRQRRHQQRDELLQRGGSDSGDDGGASTRQQEQQQEQEQEQDALSAALHTTLSPPSAVTPGVACVQGSIAASDGASEPAPQQQQQQQQQQAALPFSAWGRERWDEPLPAALGDGVARHGMRLSSCYAEVLGSEPEYTSCHDSFYGTVDYIWYTPAAAASVGDGGRSSSGGCAGLRPLAVLLPPRADEHLAGTYSLPSAAIPSDHISLVADFELLA